MIADFAFQVPGGLRAGETITIRNDDQMGHTVTSDDGVFDVSVGPGETATLTLPDKAGDYPFHCSLHPRMTGTLTVG